MTEPRTYLDDLLSGVTVISGGGLSEPVIANRVHLGPGITVQWDEVAEVATLVAAGTGTIAAQGGAIVGRQNGVSLIQIGSNLTASISTVGGDVTLNLAANVDAAVPTWRTLLDIDFTLQPQAWFTANGDVSIGGYTFTIENSSNVYAAGIPFGVTTGGLVLSSHAAGANYLTNRSIPLIRTRGLTFSKTRPMRARVLLDSATCAVGTARLHMACEYPSAMYRYALHAQATYAHQANSPQSMEFRRIFNGSVVQLINNGAQEMPSGQNLFGVAMPQGVHPLHPATVEVGGTAYVPWNNGERMATTAWASYDGFYPFPSSGFGLSSGYGITLGAEFSNPDANRFITIRALRIETFY